MGFERGQKPWEPEPGAELGEVWGFYDGPRQGTCRLGGEEFAFHCQEGPGERQLWTYRPIAEADVRALDLPREEWGEAWRAQYRAWLARTPATLWALSVDDQLVEWGAFEPPERDDAPGWAAGFLERLQSRVT